MHIFTVLFLLAASLAGAAGCSDATSTIAPVTSGASPDGKASGLGLSGQLMISGSLSLPSASTTNSASLLENRPVELQDTSGNVVGRGFASANGSFAVPLPGSLALNIGGNALALTDSRDYQLVSLIEDDGNGKVLALKQTVSVSAAAVASGSLNAGSVAFTEISSIKGIIKFVDAANLENPKVPRIGTDVYLPGFSLAAKTDKDGKFLILYVPPADYTLRIERATLALEKAITVAANTTLNLGEIKILADTVPPVTTPSKDSTDFREPMCVTLAADKTGSTIYYTTDGSTPLATAAFIYDPSKVVSCGSESSCPICVQGRSHTLKYFAVDTAGNAEDQQAKFYFYNNKWADPADKTAPVTTISAENVLIATDTLTRSSPATVTLSANEGATIYYTLDGTAPSTSSFIYSFPLSISTSTAIRYFSVDWALNAEIPKTKQINIYQWKKLEPTTTPTNFYNSTFSGMRFHPSLAYDPERKKIVLIVYDRFVAGSPSLRYFKSYEWDGANWVVTDEFSLNHDQMSDNSNQLPLFYDSVNHQMTFLLGKVLTVPGCAIDAYKYSPLSVSPKWTPQAITNPTSCPQANAFGPELAVSYNPVMQKALVLAKNNDNDARFRYIDFSVAGSPTWVAATQGGGNVFLEAGSNDLAAFADTSLLYASGKTFLAGGGAMAMGRTYYLTDAHFIDTKPIFTTIATPTVPQLFGGTLVHDSSRDVVMLFGGCRGRDRFAPSPCSNSFFEFDSTDWLATKSTTGPTPRRSSGVVFIPESKKFLMFGGISEFDEMLTDTWEYSY